MVVRHLYQERGKAINVYALIGDRCCDTDKERCWYCGIFMGGVDASEPTLVRWHWHYKWWYSGTSIDIVEVLVLWH